MTTTLTTTEVDLTLQLGHEDQSSETDQTPPDAIPRATVEEWFETSKRSLSQFEELESRTQKVVEAHRFDWQDALRDISHSLFEEVQMLREMNKSLATLLDGPRKENKNDRCEEQHEGEEENESNKDEEENTAEMEISMAQIRHLPWAEVALFRTPPPKRFAVEVPYNEPTAGDIQQLGASLASDMELPILAGEATDCLPRNTMPERIRLNCHRLKSFLDYQFCSGELPYNGQSPLSILRPFKLLLYLDKPIRSKVAEFEAIRKELQDSSEEEYIQALHDSPVVDMAYSKDNISELGVLELTALIMDCRCLVQFMDDTLRPAQTHLAAAPDMVRFVDLWFVFAQGSLVYIKGSSPPQKIWKVVQRTGGRRILETSEQFNDEKSIGSWAPLVLDCFYLDFDGVRFIPVFRQFEISGFDGVQAAKSLPVLPLPVAEREGFTDRAHLMARGKQFVDCTQKVLHLDYSGRCHYLDPSGRKLTDLVDKIPRSASCYSEQIDSDVIVDFTRALGKSPGGAP